MGEVSLEWTKGASELSGPGFAAFQAELTRYNAARFQPALPEHIPDDELASEQQVAAAEIVFIEVQRKAIAPLVSDVPSQTNDFMAWFERLKDSGPGQGDSLFPWLAERATAAQMQWFLLQEVAGEAGFDDLLALTQVKMPVQAKLEMARNFWDEMGRGREKAMHGPMLERLANHLGLAPTPDTVVPESLALGNTMIALARHRRYAFHSAGALGVIEMTAPTRAGYVDKGLRRLKIPPKKRHYFALHAVLDVKHSEEWNREVIRSLVAEDPRRARAIAEGAVMRLWHGARSFDRYRSEFGIEPPVARAA
jgi:pyrroloquinoline quinone (PQQ) biosynthesis protein C